jgi:argininosuccinate lyase
MIADRAALLDTLRDLPSGYHRDFQLVKPPLFRAHDTASELLPLLARFLDALEFHESALEEATSDPALQATAEALARIAEGETFRDAYHSTRQSAGEGS